VTSCAALGIARQEDLQRLRDAIDEKLRQAYIPTGTNSAQAPAPRTIQRVGVKIRLDAAIMKYLGIEDPRRVDSRTIDRLLQGPFCQKCSYLLSEWRTQSGTYYVRRECPNCKHCWTTYNELTCSLLGA
jgi:phage FluMu protein Com